MDDLRENVIRGLEICKADLLSTETCKITGCPYADIPDGPMEYRSCRIKLMTDALSLLKAQEARVMMYAEMMKAEVCFLEVKGIEEINPFIRFEVDNKSFWSSPYTNNEDDPFELLAEQEEYLINARCWTSRPTDEQREATPWN